MHQCVAPGFQANFRRSLVRHATPSLPINPPTLDKRSFFLAFSLCMVVEVKLSFTHVPSTSDACTTRREVYCQSSPSALLTLLWNQNVCGYKIFGGVGCTDHLLLCGCEPRRRLRSSRTLAGSFCEAALHHQ